MAGTKVQIGVECFGGIDNGDHVIVPTGEECKIVCKSDWVSSSGFIKYSAYHQIVTHQIVTICDFLHCS